MTVFVPIVGERQCRKCMACKPLTEFLFDRSRDCYRTTCRECMRAYARSRYRPTSDRLVRKVFTAADLDVIRTHYPQGGANACLPHLAPGIKRTQVVSVASRIGVRCEQFKQPGDTDAGDGWAVPAHDLTEQLACIRLRNWRGPVMAGPLVGVIGRVAAC